MKFSRLIALTLAGLMIALMASCSGDPENNSATGDSGLPADLPEKVTRAFAQKYPDAEVIGYKKRQRGEKIRHYVRFTDQGQEYELTISNNGRFLQLEKPVEVDELSEKIINSIADQFSEYKIEKAQFVEEKDKKYYELKVLSEENQIVYEMIFTEDGLLMDIEED